MTDYFNLIRDHLQAKKKLVFIIALLLILVLSVYLFIIKTPAFAVYIDGNKSFIVKDKNQVFQQVAAMEAAKAVELGMPTEVYKQVKYKRVFADKADLLPTDQIAQYLESELHFRVKAYAIKVNNEPVVCVRDKETAESVLAELKEVNCVLGEGEVLKSVEFEEQVIVDPIETTSDKLLDQETALQVITMGTENPEKYTVKEGDSLWMIARANDMYVDDIVNANNLDEDAVLALGQELILVKSKPYINVVAQVEGNKKENIPFATKVITDNNSRTGVKVKQEGEEGEKHIAYVDLRRNGSIEQREILEEKILKNAIDRILVKGTQVVQVASRSGGVGSGNLIWPLNGVITQYFKGSAHTGLDIGVRNGTPIKAADSGVVTFAGYQGGYGKFIIVDHGNGIITRYAHCSTLKAAAGQKVSRGDIIALSGNTGRSTGPHLHFEVLSRGSFKNPLSYLR